MIEVSFESFGEVSGYATRDELDAFASSRRRGREQELLLNWLYNRVYLNDFQ